jgi:serine/threonine protein kinase/tetratricopeptide (TPR) repeat protein
VSELAVDHAVLGQRYRLERLLGMGSTGPVWLAEDLELRVPRALKFLSELAQEELEDLKAETLRSQELTHQGIVRIYDFVRDEHHAAICMEAIDGPDLRAAQRERTPPCFHPDEVSFWMEGLCRALHHAHTFAKIIHRDLKPSNLLINCQGHLKVADFGIARAVPKRLVGSDQDARIAGTLEYISPQQLEGEVPAVADDIYSFGATLFELLAGRPPFFGEELYDQVLHRDPPSVSELRHVLDENLPTVSKNWEEIINACLSKQPQDRPESVRALADLLGLELRQMTIREPILPDGFLDDSESAVREPLVSDRRVRTLQDIPLSQGASGSRWPWIAGAGGVLTVLGLAFCRPSDVSEDEALLARGPADVDEVVLATSAVVDNSPKTAGAAADLEGLDRAVRGGDWDEAKRKLDRLSADGYGELPEALIGNARIHLAGNDLSTALGGLRALLEIEPTHAEGTRLKAVTHAALQQWQAVRPAASWAIAQPDNASVAVELLVLRGRASLRLGHLDHAIADFNQAVRAKPTDAMAHYHRGLAHREEGSLQKAIQNLTTAIQYDPQHVLARAARARLLMQDGEFERSASMIVEDLSHAINADPEDIDARLDRMNGYYQLQRWNAVVDDAKILLEREPRWEDVQSCLAIALVKCGDYENASIADLRLYSKEFPDDLNHWYSLAERYLAASRFTEAKDAFAEIIRLDPRSVEAREGRAFAFYSIAKELAKADKHGKLRHTQRLLGIKDINIFLAQAPEKATADTYLLKVKLLFYRGDYAEATSTARVGRQQFPKSHHEFDWWIDEIKVASKLERGKAVRGRPDRPNWFERFFKRKRKS